MSYFRSQSTRQKAKAAGMQSESVPLLWPAACREVAFPESPAIAKPAAHLARVLIMVRVQLPAANKKPGLSLPRLQAIDVICFSNSRFKSCCISLTSLQPSTETHLKKTREKP